MPGFLRRLLSSLPGVSLDKDLAKAVRPGARGLRISVSGYLRMLADQDIGGGQIRIAGPEAPQLPLRSRAEAARRHRRRAVFQARRAYKGQFQS